MQQVPKKPKRFPRGKRNFGWKFTHNQSNIGCGKSRALAAEVHHILRGPGIFLKVSRPAIQGYNVRRREAIPAAKTIHKRGRVVTSMLLSEESAVALYEALHKVMESARLGA